VNKTSIEWVKNPDNKTQGFTWNPITGCLNHNNGMCLGGGFPCYAYKLAHGRLKQRYLNNRSIAKLPQIVPKPSNPFYPRFWTERLKEPYLVRKPRGIFTVDMGELFGDWIPQNWQEAIMGATLANPQHRFYLLTKQPQNLIKWSPFPENCWVGVTATNNEAYQLAKWYLNRIEAKVKYISFEPLLEAMPMSPPIGIDWAIIGAQTKPYKPPEIKWVEDLVYLLDRYRTPVFFKDNLKPLFAETVTIDDKWVWAKDRGYGGLYRQEMPVE